MPRKRNSPPPSDSSAAGASRPAMFNSIPKLIKRKGRVAGFEKMRDMALADWEVLCGKMNPYSALKLAIEFDRHAMFAEVAAEKSKGAFDRDLWNQYQDYLHGKIEAPIIENQEQVYAQRGLAPDSYIPTAEPEGAEDTEDTNGNEGP